MILFILKIQGQSLKLDSCKTCGSNAICALNLDAGGMFCNQCAQAEQASYFKKDHLFSLKIIDSLNWTELNKIQNNFETIKF